MHRLLMNGSGKKKTQKKYLIQQIAALQVYIGFLQKGYAIAKTGLNTISDIKNGELNLHDVFFNSLKLIHPQIRNYAKVPGIIALQVKIVQVYTRSYRTVQQSNFLNTGEISYVERVYRRLLEDCAEVIDELITVTTTNKLEMSDDERLKRIDSLYQDMQDKYTFVQSFGNETRLLIQARVKEKNSIQSSRILNGLP